MQIEPHHPLQGTPRVTLIDRVIRFCLENKLVVFLVMVLFIGWGVVVAPFDWDITWLHRDPVPVDAIPDIGENQQIVFTEWAGRSPRDIENQITYPLSAALMGLPQVKTIRSLSMFGFSSIYIIFNERADFYDSRSRILEKLNSLPASLLPDGVKPALGPDATALGQIFWYTLEGRTTNGAPAGGWDPDELRTLQDWYVRPSLLAAEGVSEVAAIGGFVKEYDVDVNPNAMRAANIALEDVTRAVQNANSDVGAGVVVINNVEYLIRGLGFVKTLHDVEEAVVTVNNNVPLYVKNVATVALGPALRTGVLDKEGAEAVGGVVVARHGANPLAVIKNVKKKIEETAAALPVRTLPDGSISRVTIVPFYDRSGLIYETLGTLNTALFEQILVTTIVVLIMVMHVGSSLLISSVMPLAVLAAFIAMKVFGVDANIVSLSGIAIAIGTLVDMGIIMCENILRHLDIADPAENRLEVVYRAASEVGSAVLTAIATTIVGFLPVFAMEGPEGKLFRPLAFTKTFALLGSVIVAITIIPAAAHLLLAGTKRAPTTSRRVLAVLLCLAGVLGLFTTLWWLGIAAALWGAWLALRPSLSDHAAERAARYVSWLLAAIVGVILCARWLPLGPDKGLTRNVVFGGVLIAGLTSLYMLRQVAYEKVLRWCLGHKKTLLLMPVLVLVCGMLSWLGFDGVFGWLPHGLRMWPPLVRVAHAFPGLGREFMPPLDEGSFLFMPTTMAHASISEAHDILRKQDMAIRALPEIDTVVGKLGRADSALDPAPISMIETVINYNAEYLSDRNGARLTFAFDPATNDLVRTADGTPVAAPDGLPYTVPGRFARDVNQQLIPQRYGKPFRRWRPALEPALNPGRAAWAGITKPDDIWDEITRVAAVPGTTSAPKLQPIAARIVMLQTGIRAPMGVKIKGRDLETIQQAGMAIEQALREVPMIEPATVIADRIIGKPYLEIAIDRAAIARYGVTVRALQDVIETAIGGMHVTTTVEGRERYVVRVRYQRELRDSIEALHRIIVPTPTGAQVPLAQLATIKYTRGPEMIKSEDSFLVGYVLFDKKPNVAEVDAVQQARDVLTQKSAAGSLQLPVGISYTFIGAYENHARAQKKLLLVVPVALLVIFLILYLQFKDAAVTSLVFLTIPFVASGGFILLWLYGQPWFLDFSAFGVNVRELFQVHPINMSIAIWVGFIALFGIASDDGVVMATYLDELFVGKPRMSIDEIRETTIVGGKRRVRACMMTTATTVLALLPVLTSTGRGADIMIPMSIPTFGGMLVEMLTTLIVPVLYCAIQERRMKAAA